MALGFPTRRVREGLVELLVPDVPQGPGPGTRSALPFYNPAMAVARDVSVVVAGGRRRPRPAGRRRPAPRAPAPGAGPRGPPGPGAGRTPSPPAAGTSRTCATRTRTPRSARG